MVAVDQTQLFAVGSRERASRGLTRDPWSFSGCPQPVLPGPATSRCGCARTRHLPAAAPRDGVHRPRHHPLGVALFGPLLQHAGSLTPAAIASRDPHHGTTCRPLDRKIDPDCSEPTLPPLLIAASWAAASPPAPAPGACPPRGFREPLHDFVKRPLGGAPPPPAPGASTTPEADSDPHPAGAGSGPSPP